jgi:hypothetical protein
MFMGSRFSTSWLFGVLVLLSLAPGRACAQSDPRVYLLDPWGSSCPELKGAIEIGSGDLLLCTQDASGVTLLRTTEMGDVVWKRVLPTSMDTIFEPVACGLLDDQTAYVAGTWVGSGGDHFDAFLIKVSLDGDLVWTARYRLPDVIDDWFQMEAVKAAGGIRAVLRGNHALWVVQLTDDGTVQWCKKMILPWYFYNAGQTAVDQAGRQVFSCTLTDGFGAIAPWVVCMDQNGEVLWQKLYQFEVVTAVGSICATSDGGFLLGGNDLLMKLDSAGGVVWRKEYTAQWIWVSQIREATGGGLLLATAAYPDGPKLMRTTSEGVPLSAVWMPVPNAGDETSVMIAAGSDGGIAVVGRIAVNVPGWASAYGIYQANIPWDGPFPCRFEAYPITVGPLSAPPVTNTEVIPTLEATTTISPAGVQCIVSSDTPSSFCEVMSGVVDGDRASSARTSAVIVARVGDDVPIGSIPARAMISVLALTGHACDVPVTTDNRNGAVLRTQGLVPGVYAVRISAADGSWRTQRFILQ